MMKERRLFTAIKIHPDECFLELFNKLKKSLQFDKIKWVEEGNIHMTLKFIGETPEDRIGDITKALEKASAGIRPFELVLEDVGIFGSSYKPRVVWFGIRQEPELLKLSENMFRELENIGFERDRQNFVPHLTVGRVRFVKDKKIFRMVIEKNKPGLIQKINIDKFYLFESILRREGPVYEIVETFGLG